MNVFLVQEGGGAALPPDATGLTVLVASLLVTLAWVLYLYR